MASVGHVVVGVIGAEVIRAMRQRARGSNIPAHESTYDRGSRALLFACLSLLPDADAVAFALGIPYEHPFGHRGASHSLVFAVAIGLAIFAVTALRKDPQKLLVSAVAFVVIASHGLLDMLTDGGLGVALFWPFDQGRYFFPWQPIPVAPIGRGLISARGAYVMGVELLFSAPLLLAIFVVDYASSTRFRPKDLAR